MHIHIAVIVGMCGAEEGTLSLRLLMIYHNRNEVTGRDVFRDASVTQYNTGEVTRFDSDFDNQ